MIPKRGKCLVDGRIKAGVLLLVCCLLLSSCGLLPQEEEYGTAPTVREYESEDYSYTSVSKEDIQLTKKVSCVYSSAQESQLSFGVSGERVQDLYVSLGDIVEQGDLLAELNMGNLPDEWQAVDAQREEKELEQKHLVELLDLERRRMQASGERESPAEKHWEKQRREGAQELELLEARLEALQKKIDARRLIAPMDGSIFYVKSDLAGQTSKKDEVVLRIVSGEECYFVADAAEADMLQEGDSVSVIVSSTVYETQVRFSEEKPQEEVYFVISAGDGQPEMGSKGSATIVLEERKDVLCLANQAIKRVGEDSVVYYEDENGIKAMKYIETGLQGNQKTEILSGLKFGETVIVK